MTNDNDKRQGSQLEKEVQEFTCLTQREYVNRLILNFIFKIVFLSTKP